MCFIEARFLCFCLVIIFKAYLPNSSRGTHSTVYFDERDIVQNWDDLKYCLALDEFQTMTAAAKEKIFQTLVLLSSSLERNLTVGSVFSFDSNHSDRKTPSGSLKRDLSLDSVLSLDSNHGDGNPHVTYQSVSLIN